MENTNQDRSSPWPRRLVLGGIIFAVLGFFLLVGQGSSIDSIFNPQTSNVVEFSGEDSETLDLERGCYRLVQITGSSTLNVTLTAVDGSNLTGEAITEKSCKLDWQPQSPSATYSTTASWDLQEGSYFLEVTCPDDCTSTSSWLISIDDMQKGFFSNNLLVIGLSMCCLSILVLPMGLVLSYSNSKNKNPNVVLMNQHGHPVHLENLPPHIAQQIQEELTNFPPQQQQIAPPFANQPQTPQQQSDVRDGSLEVQQGKLMTTEQVYALMRGDIESAQNFNPGGQIDNEKVMDDAANAVAIASWDEGAPTQPVDTKSPTPQQPKLRKTPEKSESSSSWKDWDEMN
jgi:hypothetical protein